MLRAPDFPSAFAHLVEWHAEFLLWHDQTRPPEWVDWQAWATMMQRAVTPFDLRLLARIHAAYCAVQQRSQSHG